MMGTEFQECCVFWQWLNLMGIADYSFHIANEMKTTKYTGARLKKIGKRAGVSDYFIGIARGGFHGCFLEMKVGNNKPTKVQCSFASDMCEEGYYCVWVTGFDQAKEAVEYYLALEST